MDTNVYKRAFSLFWLLLLIASVNTQNRSNLSDTASDRPWYIGLKEVYWTDIFTWLFNQFAKTRQLNNDNLTLFQDVNPPDITGSKTLEHDERRKYANEKENLDNKRPIFIFSGLASNRLYHEQSKWTNCYWLDKVWIEPKAIFGSCWRHTIMLGYSWEKNKVFDTKTKITINMGSTTDLEDLAEFMGKGLVFQKMVKGLISKGFRREKHIFGVPQDWRKSVKDQTNEYYEEIRKLIQTNVNLIGNKATLVCHSYGCLNLAEFVSRTQVEHLDPYIAEIITLGAPWGGSMNALRALLSGDNLGVSYFNYENFNEIQQTFTSFIHLIPVREVLKYQELVYFHGTNYTLDNIGEVLNLSDANSEMMRNRTDINLLIHAFDKLNNKTINITNIYGTGIPTIAHLHYKGKIFILNGTLTMDMSDTGDGTVAEASLALICKKTYVRCIKWPKADHFGIIHNDNVIDIIGNASVVWSW